MLNGTVGKDIPSVGIQGQNVVQFVTNVLTQDFTPILQIIGDISYFIGLCFLIVGLSRLHRHGQNAQQMMYRVSPIGTALYFVSAIALISFIPQLHMLSDSLFNANNVLINNCMAGQGQVPNTPFYTSTNSFCPEMAYVSDINNAAEGDKIGEAIKYMAFGTLMIVGVISFIRGMMLLVRIGEGQGQGTTAKAMTHIFAGVAAVNADNLYYLAQNIVGQAGGGVASMSLIIGPTTT